MPDDAPIPAAERQRRHRERRRHGVFVVPVEVTGAMVEALVDQGDVDEANSSDLDRDSPNGSLELLMMVAQRASQHEFALNRLSVTRDMSGLCNM